MPTKVQEVISIQRIKYSTIEIPIIGISQLVIHNWSEKAMMQLGGFGKKTVKRKGERSPAAEWLGSMHLTNDGLPGFPASGFKGAIVAGCRQMVKGPAMTQVKSMFFVEADDIHTDLVRIYGCCLPRMDIVRVSNGSPDLRFRVGWLPWVANIRVTFNAEMFKPDDVINLLDAGGNSGVAEWRPSSKQSLTGTWGRYKVADLKEYNEVIEKYPTDIKFTLQTFESFEKELNLGGE
jgi:hypothetical protein